MSLKILSLMFPVMFTLLLTLNCKNEEASGGGGAPPIINPNRPVPKPDEPIPVVNNTPPPAGLRYTRLTFQEKLQVPSQKISAIGRSGDGTFLYFGDRDHDNVFVAVQLAANPPVVTEIKTCVVKDGKCARYWDNKNGAQYNAAYPGNPPEIADKTQIKSIVATAGKKAVFSLTGLVSDQYYEKGGIIFGKDKFEAAQGGILQVDGPTVKGVWGNIPESLNLRKRTKEEVPDERKEITSIATVGGSWVAYAADNASSGSYNAFDAKPAKAVQSQVDNQGKIVTAAVGAGTSLYRGLSDGSVRRLLNAETNLGNKAAEDIIVDSNAKLKITGSTDTNEIISALGVVGTTLLIGLEARPETKTGGVALVDLNDPAFPVTAPPAALSQWSVRSIVLSQDGASALITTNGQGILFFKDGQLNKISRLALQNRASQENPLEFDASKIVDAEKEGFSLEHASVGATNIGDTWYIATDDNGIFWFKAEDITQ